MAKKPKYTHTANPIVESHLFQAATLAELRDAVKEFVGDADCRWIGQVPIPGGETCEDGYECLLYFREMNGPCYMIVSEQNGAVLKGDVYATL